MCRRRATSYEVYLIESVDYWYVGSASGKVSAATRMKAHLRGWGNAPRLKEAVQLGGRFSQVILESGYGDPIPREQAWYELGILTEERECLNIRQPQWWNGVMRGRTHSLESRAKMSASLVGKSLTPEHRAAIGRGITGRPMSDKTRHALLVARQSTKGINPAINQQRVKCGCGLVSTPGPMGRHRKASGHVLET